MSDITELAEKVNKETPWWAAAPILAASIVGVPSLMAIGAGYYITSFVTKELRELKTLNQTEVTKLEVMEKNWEVIRRNIAMGVELQLRTCVHQAQDEKQRDDCMKGISGVGAK